MGEALETLEIVIAIIFIIVLVLLIGGFIISGVRSKRLFKAKIKQLETERAQIIDSLDKKQAR